MSATEEEGGSIDTTIPVREIWGYVSSKLRQYLEHGDKDEVSARRSISGTKWWRRARARMGRKMEFVLLIALQQLELFNL